MERRAFIRVLGGGTVAAATGLGLAGCSADLPPEALAAWAGPGAAPAATADPRHWLLAHAILAPHSHNLQSWLVDLREADAITLYCDRSRLLPETDPFSRQMMMSQGTFLEALDLAAREIGLAADITLFPQGTPRPEQLTDAPPARIRLRRDQGSYPEPLFRQILLRRTNRSPYEAHSPAGKSLAMKFYFLLPALLFLTLSACSQPQHVGGSCEGCEAIYENKVSFDQLPSSDTLPGYYEKGNKLLVTGKVFKADGKIPAEGVILYLYHTNAEGIYPTRGNETGWDRQHGYLRGCKNQ